MFARYASADETLMPPYLIDAAQERYRLNPAVMHAYALVSDCERYADPIGAAIALLQAQLRYGDIADDPKHWHQVFDVFSKKEH